MSPSALKSSWLFKWSIWFHMEPNHQNVGTWWYVDEARENGEPLLWLSNEIYKIKMGDQSWLCPPVAFGTNRKDTTQGKTDNCALQLPLAPTGKIQHKERLTNTKLLMNIDSAPIWLISWENFSAFIHYDNLISSLSPILFVVVHFTDQVL
jgi:hypothetical protein